MLHNMVARVAPMQLSIATDRPGVETSPRGWGWHAILLPPVPKKPRILLPQPCLYLLCSPQKTERLPWLLHSSSPVGCQVEATILIPYWLKADSVQPARRASRSGGQGRSKVQKPLYPDTTSTAAATGLAGPAVLCSVICCL